MARLTRVARYAALIAVVAALSADRSVATVRWPVMGCEDERYSFENRWQWAHAPTGLCETSVNLVGIDHARWRFWGSGHATATASFVDSLGFEYPATIVATGLRSCHGCNGIEAPRAWYRFVHVSSPGGVRGGVMRGPFDITLHSAPERRIVTLADFTRRQRSLRMQFAIGYMTSHPDRVCYHGNPTPANVAANIAGAIADYRPGVDPATGATVPADEPIGRAIRNAEAEIGC